jgi:predicted house-cleaning NTP pyrophosphatase (Maf/HAM1 superfamily)
MLSPDIDEKAVGHGSPVLLPLFVAHAKACAILEQLQREEGASRSRDSDSEPIGRQRSESGSGPRLLVTADQVAVAPRGKSADGTLLPPSARLEDSEAASDECPPADLEFVVLPEFEMGDLEVHEKPTTKEEAAAFIRGYSGSSVKLMSAMVLTEVVTGRKVGGVTVNTVNFGPIPEEHVQEALEPKDVASPSPGFPPGHADLMTTCGGVCVEHPAIFPHVLDLSAPMDEIWGLPAHLLATLIQALGRNIPSELAARTREE